MKYVLVLIFCVSQIAFAAKPSKQKLNLKEKSTTTELLKAQAEEVIVTPVTKKAKVTDVQISTNSSLLKLKDPKIIDKKRDFSYLARFSFGAFTPNGQTTNSSGQVINFKDFNTQFLPSMSIGFEKKSLFLESEAVNYEVSLQLGFFNQSSNFKLNNGYVISDAKLNSLLTALNTEVHLQIPQSSAWLEAGARFGQTTYTQTSQNSFAQFSKTIPFAALKLGLSTALNPKWKIGLNYLNHSNISNESINNSPHRLEVSTKVVW